MMSRVLHRQQTTKASDQLVSPNRPGTWEGMLHKPGLATGVEQQMCKLKNNDGIKSTPQVLCSQLTSPLALRRGGKVAQAWRPQ